MDINRRRDKVAGWINRGEHFTEYDLPECAISRAYLAEHVVPYLIRFCGCGRTIVMLDSVIHFNKAGYKRIIECAERRELLRPDRMEEWKRIANEQMGIKGGDAACQ